MVARAKVREIEAEWLATRNPKERKELEKLRVDAEGGDRRTEQRRHARLASEHASRQEARHAAIRSSSDSDNTADLVKLARRRFRTRFGRAWDEEWRPILILNKDKVRAEREARQLWRRLEAYVRRERSKGLAGRGPARAALLNLCEPAIRDGIACWLESEQWTDDPRVHLVRTLDRINVFGIGGERSKGTHRGAWALSEEDLAIVAVLLGLRVARRDEDPAEALAREAEAMKKVIDRRAKRLLSGRSYQRGPQKRGGAYPA